MKNLQASEIWYITGSQHLYGEETLKQVTAHSQKVVNELNGSKKMALPLVFKSLVTKPEEIRRVCQEASSDPNCASLILWMHTFSPSKMWIGGLSALRKPFLHLHTQFNRDLPWGEIDMDFMNLNQAAHGDREAGFAGEGDWKTCALVRAMKVIAADLKGGTSFMEDYTYHLSPKGHQVLGSHMLEVCESIAASKPKLEIHPLGIGGKEDPVRLVFDAPPGNAINVSVIDLGNRFRMIVNEVKVVKPQKPLPKLPVARAVWECLPDFKTTHDC